MVTGSDFHTYYRQTECPRRLWLATHHPELCAMAMVKLRSDSQPREAKHATQHYRLRSTC